MREFKVFVDELNNNKFVDLLSTELGLNICKMTESDSIHGNFTFIDDRLIYNSQEFLGKEGKIFFDFIKEWKYHYKKNYSIKKEPLAKALGLKGGTETVVWDLTCGTGKDSILMMSFGAKIKAFERSPVVGALLLDAKRKGDSDSLLGPVLSEKFELSIIDSNNIDLDEKPDVVYIDPMYPHKKKKALPRKEMLIFREIVGDDEDSVELFNSACKMAKKRVVVKRPVYAPPLIEKPSASYTGKSTRYDMYIIT